MLYGYKRPGNITVVTAATLKSELNDFFERAAQRPELYVNMVEPDFVTQLTDPELKDLKHEIRIFDHTDEAQQEQFIDAFDITVGPFQAVMGMHNDMIKRDEPDPFDVNDTRTIEEIHGLQGENDVWDTRTDEQKAEDEQIKEAIKKARKDGMLSDESFSPRKQEGEDSKKTVKVTKINTSVDADGNVSIDRVLARKDTTENEHEVRQEEPKPQDPNATVTLTFGPGVKETRRVIWHGREIVGADDLINAVYRDEKYREEFRYGLQPDFMVEADDGQITRGHYEILFGELVTEHRYGEQQAS